MREFFRKFATTTSHAVGSAWAFLIALLVVVIWALTGPAFHFSDTWQLVINTGTTVVTFLMVFLIQNTQNRDARVVHLKLDELLRAVGPARTTMAELENLSDRELDHFEREFKEICERERHAHPSAQRSGPETIREAIHRAKRHHRRD